MTVFFFFSSCVVLFLSHSGDAVLRCITIFIYSTHSFLFPPDWSYIAVVCLPLLLVLPVLLADDDIDAAANIPIDFVVVFVSLSCIIFSS